MGFFLNKRSLINDFKKCPHLKNISTLGRSCLTNQKKTLFLFLFVCYVTRKNYYYNFDYYKHFLWKWNAVCKCFLIYIFHHNKLSDFFLNRATLDSTYVILPTKVYFPTSAEYLSILVSCYASTNLQPTSRYSTDIKITSDADLVVGGYKQKNNELQKIC